MNIIHTGGHSLNEEKSATATAKKKAKLQPNNVCIAILRLCGNNNNCCKWHLHCTQSIATHSQLQTKVRPQTLCARSQPVTQPERTIFNKTKQNILNYWSNWHEMALRSYSKHHKKENIVKTVFFFSSFQFVSNILFVHWPNETTSNQNYDENYELISSTIEQTFIAHKFRLSITTTAYKFAYVWVRV